MLFGWRNWLSLNLVLVTLSWWLSLSNRRPQEWHWQGGGYFRQMEAPLGNEWDAQANATSNRPLNASILVPPSINPGLQSTSLHLLTVSPFTSLFAPDLPPATHPKVSEGKVRICTAEWWNSKQWCWEEVLLVKTTDVWDASFEYWDRVVCDSV